MKARKSVALLGLVALGSFAVACGGDDASETTTSDGSTQTTAAGGNVCPEKLTIQTDWFPELEHGGTYQLIGPDGTANKDTVSYSGPVQEQYAVGGLKELEITTIKFDKANSSVLVDGEADMAYIGIADVIKDSKLGLVAIMKTLDKDPQMVMWDPAQYDIKTPEDIKATGAAVLHFPGVSYIDYMIGKGYMTADQSNPSYDGSDAKWVAEGGSIFQQGFATNEVYKYENEIAWKDGAPAPVAFYTVGELGFDNYPAAITMTRDHAAELSDCLKLLVPKMAQAWVDFYNDPTPVMDAMIEINTTHDGFWGLSKELNTAGIALLEEKEIGANSSDGTYCSLDTAKVQAMYDLLSPIFTEQGVEIEDSIDSLYNNEYCAGAPGR
ncbi:MAG: hypothetical protein ACO3C1_05265 [Ilumatobacteraceae bacterium]